MRTPLQVIVDGMIRVLTRPRRSYRRYGRNDPVSLKKHIRTGDVVLVDGDQRVSQAIKTLTMSSWSHNVVYIGDEILKRDHPWKERVLRRFGREAHHLVIEALIQEGVVVSPLVKYLDFNIRICRPHGLTEADRDVVVGELLSHLGSQYDMRNFFDLARYLLPFHLVPARFREDALHLGSGRPTETICSSLTAAAFQKVGFPIVPDWRSERASTIGWRLRQALLGRPTRRAYSGIFRARHPTLVVPRDFDLSPYFEIVKFNLIAGGFDYKKMRWAPTPQQHPFVGGKTR